MSVCLSTHSALPSLAQTATLKLAAGHLGPQVAEGDWSASLSLGQLCSNSYVYILDYLAWKVERAVLTLPYLAAKHAGKPQNLWRTHFVSSGSLSAAVWAEDTHVMLEAEALGLLKAHSSNMQETKWDSQLVTDV